MADVVNVGNIQVANAVSVVYTAGNNINISDDRVISATVPTKTSDLANDSGYITNETDGLVNYTDTNELNTLLSAKANSSDVYTKTESDNKYALSNNVYTKAQSDGKYSLITETGNKIDLSINSSTYVMTMNLKDKNNNVLSTGTVDLPLESVVVNGRYDDTTKELILTLQNGNEIRISVADLISGLQETLIAGNNIQIEGNTISATDTTYTAGENVTITGTTISAKDTTYTLSGNTADDVATITLTDSDSGTSTATVDMSKYQDEIDSLNEIVDGLPHVNGEDAELYLSPTIKAPMDIELKGNTGQFTTTGKNLLNIVGVKNEHGIISTGTKDGKIVCNGTTDDTFFTITQGINDFPGNVPCNLPAGTYTFSIQSTLTWGLNIRFYNSSKTNIAQERISTGQKSVVITANESVAYYRLYGAGDITSGKAINNVIYPMLESGSTATSFEPYTGGIPAPNPDYPERVEVVSGDNTVQICGRNLFSGYTKGVGLSTVDGSETVSAKSATTGYIPVDLSGSAKYILTGLPSTLFNLIAAYDSNKQFLGRTGGGNPTSWTFNSTSFAIGTKIGLGDIKYIRVTFYEHSSVTGVIDDLDNAQLMLEHGDTASTYEPYTGQNYQINLPVENLFDKSNANTTDLFINTSTNKYQQNNNAKLLYISCKPNTTYTVSRTAGQRFIVGDSASVPTASGDVNNIVQSNTATSITTTTSSTAKYLAVFYYLSTADTSTEQQILDSIQIEKGSKANSYTPYGTTPIEMCKIGDYQDYFYKENGNWYKKKTVGKVVLTGSEYWQKLGNAFQTGSDTTPNKGSVSLDAYSNYFIHQYYPTSITTNIQNGEFGWNSGKNLTMRNDNCATANDFTTWLSNHNVDVYYILLTPVSEQITDSTLISQLDAIQQARSYKTQTNITQVNNDKPFIISASALYDLSALISA